MNLLEQFGQYLIDNGFATAIGTDLFFDSRPNTPIEVITLYEFSGGPSQIGVSAQDHSIQITIRSISRNTAQTSIQAIYNFLDQIYGRIHILPDTTRVVINLRNMPIKIGEDANNNPIVGFNLGIIVPKV